MEVKETSFGWRADHKVGGHDDYVVAVALAAHAVATVVPEIGGAMPMRGNTIDVSSWGRRRDPYNSGAVQLGTTRCRGRPAPEARRVRAALKGARHA